MQSWPVDMDHSPWELTFIDGTSLVINIEDRFGLWIEKSYDVTCATDEFMQELEELYRAVHTINAIKCKMRPQLKAEYDAWLNSKSEDDVTEAPPPFDSEALLKYVSRITLKDAEGNEKVEMFWKNLVNRWTDLTCEKDKERCIFERSQSTTKDVNYNKLEVCSIVGYLHNKEKYPSYTQKKLATKLDDGDEGVTKESIHRYIKKYSTIAPAHRTVIDEVIKEVWG